MSGICLTSPSARPPITSGIGYGILSRFASAFSPAAETNSAAMTIWRSPTLLVEERLARPCVLARHVEVQLHAEPRGVGHADAPPVDDRPVPAGGEVLPVGHAHAVPLEREEVRHRRRDVDG